jgi:hypothetical protein
MKKQVLEEARIFALNYFGDKKISLQNYLMLTEDKLNEFKSLDEKLTFVLEIIRLGRDQMDSSVNSLKKMEIFELPTPKFVTH